MKFRTDFVTNSSSPSLVKIQNFPAVPFWQWLFPRRSNLLKKVEEKDVSINQPQEEIIYEINNQKDLDKISHMKLDLLLPQCQQTKRDHYTENNDESMLSPLAYPQILPVKAQKTIPLKKAAVKVNSINMTVIKQKKLVRDERIR